MILDIERPIAEFVNDDLRTADIFYKYHIDFCCGGKQKLVDACRKKNVSVEEIMQAIEKLGNPGLLHDKFDSCSEVIQTLLETFHAGAREKTPILIGYIDRIADRHGDTKPVYFEVQKLVHQLLDELEHHMQKEEFVLFPYVLDLEEAVLNHTQKPTPMFGTVQNPISMMESDHDEAGEVLHKLNELLNDYEICEDHCNTQKAFMRLMKEFEKELYLHVHLENNVLFKKAVDLELHII